MNNIFFVVWAFVIGLMVPLQSIINAKLSSKIGGATQAALVSFTGGFLIFLIYGIANYRSLPPLGKVLQLPPHLLSGGAIGALFVLSAIYLVPKLGSTGWIALIVTGQLLASLFFDHIGLFGLNVKTLNAARVIGALLLLCGSTLIVRF